MKQIVRVMLAVLKILISPIVAIVAFFVWGFVGLLMTLMHYFFVKQQ